MTRHGKTHMSNRHAVRRRRQEARERLLAALADPEHRWKAENGPEKAKMCLANLDAKGG